MKLIYVFDLDHTLCDLKKKSDGNWDYLNATPYVDRIHYVNKLFEQGNVIVIETARGSVSGFSWHQATYDQLNSWGLKFSELRTGIKFAADVYIDDKAINSEDFFN
jgi:CMP-N,N'-diacetyllegionaminic acid synthase